MKRRICFVTFELYPFTGGGIGTWLANTLVTYATKDVEFDVLFWGSQPPSLFAMAKTYPQVGLYTIDIENPDPSLLEGRLLRRDHFRSFAHWRSFLFMCALESMERASGPYSVIEFVDWCGAAFASIQAKRMGRSFQQTCLSVRLHVAEAVLRAYETRPWSHDNLVIADLERQSLRDADIVVAHLASTADVVQSYFGFPTSWREHVKIELPPVIVTRPASTFKVDWGTSILFTSKIQACKRPEIFARGVSRFAVDNPDYVGSIRYLAFNVSSDLRQVCEAAVPNNLKDRVQFGGPTDRSEREALIENSIAVFPNIFEAFCFAAYEASLCGAVVLLNRANPSFGKGTPWVDGENCLTFDGTSQGLANALGQIFSNPSMTENLRPVLVPHAAHPYWEEVALAETGREKPTASTGAIVLHRYEGPLLYESVDSLLNAPDAPDQLTIVTEATGEPSADLVLSALEQVATEGAGNIRVLRELGRSGPGHMLASGLSASSGEIIAVVPAGFEIAEGFLEKAVRALAMNPEHDVVLATIGIIAEDARFTVTSAWLPLGASVYQALGKNCITPGAFVARRTFLSRFMPDETLTAEWVWDIMLRGAFAGCRYLVWDEPGFTAVPRVLHDYDAHYEGSRRVTIEAIRRRQQVAAEGAAVNLSFLGDLELGAVERHHFGTGAGRDERELSELSLRAETTAREHAALKNSTSVIVALKAANFVAKAVPWAVRPMRRLLRCTRN